MGKVELTIRCAKCDNIEKVTTEAWAAVRTTCGCNGPYRVVERRKLADPAPEDPAEPQPKESTS